MRHLNVVFLSDRPQPLVDECQAADAQPEPQIPAGPVTIEPSATPPIGAMRQDALQVVKPAESKTAPPAVGMIPARR